VESLQIFGKYESTLDPKGRFLLPAALKKRMPNLEEEYWLSSGREKRNCIELFPGIIWIQRLQYIYSKAKTNPAARNYATMLQEESHPVSIDSAGRVLIPKIFLEKYNIQKEVSLTGAETCIEIWPKGYVKEKLPEIVGSVVELEEEFNKYDNI
jgi:MraZ protein